MSFEAREGGRRQDRHRWRTVRSRTGLDRMPRYAAQIVRYEISGATQSFS